MKKLLFLLLLPFVSTAQLFVNYNYSNSPLPDNQCRYIAVDFQNRKWFCTEFGLAIYNDTSWTVYTQSNSGLSDNSVKFVSFETNGKAWIATQNGGVCSFDGTNWQTFNSANGLQTNSVRSIRVGSDGRKWACTIDGLSVYNDTSWTSYAIYNGNVPITNITCIGFESDSVRWIGTLNGGLVRMENDSFQVFNALNSGLPDNTVLDIEFDNAGFKWMACPAAGLLRMTTPPNYFLYNNLTSGMPTNTVTSVLIDSLQQLFLGSFDKGLILKNGNQYTSWNTTNSAIPDDLIYAVTIDHNGYIWLGTGASGVVRFDFNQWTTIEKDFYSSPNIFPNPFSNHLNIGELQGELIITDVSGKFFFEIKSNDKIEINTENWSSGIYLLKNINENGVRVARLIKI